MVLINLKIKLIDGGDALVLIDDQKTIVELRDSIAEATQIPRDNQRLIFRGKLLKDDCQKIGDCGLEDQMALHVVTRPAQSEQREGHSSSSFENQFQQHPPNSGEPHHLEHQTQIITQNIIFGQVPFERTQLFQEPNNALSIVDTITEHLRVNYHMETEQTLRVDHPRNDDFLISISLRGIRQQIINSPAYERFEQLWLSLKNLAWLVALIQSQFIEKIDAEISDQQIDTERQYRNIASILMAMHAFDHGIEEQMENFVAHQRDDEIFSLIEQLNGWNVPNDESHIQQVNQYIAMRHCTSNDLSTILMMLSVIDAKINEHLMNRYYKILSLQHNLHDSSYPARLLNCYANAISRVQHFRAHIYHGISDLVLHVDQNEHNRLYPVFAQHRNVEEPPQAEITLLFISPRVHDSQNSAQPPQDQSDSPPVFDQNAQPQNTAARTLNILLGGFMQFAHQLMGNTDLRSSGALPRGGGGGEAENRQQQPPNVFPPNIPPILRAPIQQLNQSIIQMQQGQNNPEGSRIPHNQSTTGASVRNQNAPPAGPPFPMGFRSNISWERASPQSGNAMFIGPNPPGAFPLFTMDPHLSCPSRRYRIFEVDSRNANFWNDPQTIAFGIRPPPNSVAAEVQHRNGRLNNGPVFSRSAPSQNDPPNHEEEIEDLFNERISIQPPSNNRGQAVFTEVEQFTHFVRQTLESIANCMARYDSRILHEAARPSREFTARSRVAGYIPVAFAPVPVPHPPMQGPMPNNGFETFAPSHFHNSRAPEGRGTPRDEEL